MRTSNSRIFDEHRGDGDEAPFPSTSAQLLVTEAEECSNTVKTSTFNSKNNNRNARTTTRRTDGCWYFSVPQNESNSSRSGKNRRLFKTAQQIGHFCHENVLNISNERTPTTTTIKKSAETTKALEAEGADDDEAEEQRRPRGRKMMKPFFEGPRPRRRRKHQTTTSCQISRRRMLLISSVISCSFLLVFLLILLSIFTQHPFLPHIALQNGTSTFSTMLDDDLSNELGNFKLIRRLRGAFSEMRPDNSKNAQIWLLNTQEFGQRARRYRREKEDDSSLVGLARNCGQLCTVRLNHEVNKIHMGTVRIQLERQMADGLMAKGERRRRRRRRSSNRQNFAAFRPIVQTMEFDNHTLFRHSQVSPKCFYNARVNDNQQQSVVNLCDANGGLFGTLSLDEGTFVIEPLVVIEEEQQQRNGATHDVEVRKRKRHLAAELDSDLRAHLVYRLQAHYFETDITDNHHHQNNGTTTATSDQAPKEVPMPSNSLLLTVDDGISRTKRSAISWEHFVEVLVVADYKMLLYHQHNLENYVLTLFATVSAIYRHASLGAAINVIVVKLVVLKHDRAGPDISNRAQETLQYFCKWQNSFNDHNDEALNHHDVAILLTRHDICRATNKCDTLGLAELGTMCDGRKSCAIIEDNGLSAAFTIAHELGHIFNIPHDDERKCSEFMPLNKNSYHIMAPTLEYNTNPWSWSPCSSAMLLRYLDHNRAQTQCLFDKPVERRYYDRMFEPPAPGAIYSVTQQCKFVFGAAAEICPYMPTCRRLWCSVSFGYQMGCRTQHMPWADGTPCGDNMWCHRGQCVGMSPMQRQPVDGGWGEWKPWRECSRTCGGGVQKSFRDCDSPVPENGGKYCIGQRERYRPCNIQDCPWETPGFRELQCSEFDGVDIGIHGVPKTMTWVPKYTGIAENERCRLFCRAADSAAFYMLKDKVADGTPCDRNGDDICIDGTCHKAGCDHRLGSEMKRDICGVCGGNGSTCREVSGLYNERSTFGYNEVLRIPAGAAGIDITQTAHNGQKEDDNYLALRTATGEFLLNGQYQVSVFRQQIPILDTVLEYSGSDLLVERINGSGPLRSDIYLHVLSVGNLNKPNIRYHFMAPITSQIAAQQKPTQQNNAVGNTFYWRAENNWTECSMKCQGMQNQHIRCVESFSNNLVSDAHCAPIARPNIAKRMCNVDCFYKYLQRLNTDSSSGQKWYQYICVRSYTNGGKEEQAETAECTAAGLKVPRPGGSAIIVQQHLSPVPSMDHQPQQKQMPTGSQTRDSSYPAAPPHRWTTQWAYSQWTQCSESCGSGGVSRRNLHCIDTRNGQKLDRNFCEGIPHEPIETECNRTPCPRWVYSQWYQCSRSCGGGLRMRHASCQDAAGRELDARMCAAEAKQDSEKCNEQPCTHWHFGLWSPCSVSCGEGVQRREAMCVREPDGQSLDEKECEPRERIVEKQCQMAACPHWKLGSWSPCSVSCGQEGFQTRLVQCVDSAERKIADQQCMGNKKQQQTEKPQNTKVCNPGPCPYWRAAEWGQCSVSCGHGIRTRHVECVLKGQIVDDSLCMEAMRPKSSDRCVLLACAVWNAEQWGACSTSCGRGLQKRLVTCVRQPTGATVTKQQQIMIVHDRECKGPRPRTERSCERTTECGQNSVPSTAETEIRWAPGTWSDCSQSCETAEGVQRRAVDCRDSRRQLPTLYCAHLERPQLTRSCTASAAQLPPCAQWSTGEWSPCPQTAAPADAPCASSANKINIVMTAFIGSVPDRTASSSSSSTVLALQYRRVFCQFVNGTEATGEDERKHCAIDVRPPDRRPCPTGATVCSSGTLDSKSANIRPMNDAKLPGEEEADWVTGEWSLCSVSCGGGWRRRSVTCKIKGNNGANGTMTATTKCHEQEKPAQFEQCNKNKCSIGSWHAGAWSQCSVSCGSGEQLRTVWCNSVTNSLQLLDDKECPLEKKPTVRKTCNKGTCPPKESQVQPKEVPAASSSSSASTAKHLSAYQWQIGPWSQCPTECPPNGISSNRTRWVRCTDRNDWREVPAYHCDSKQKPPSEQRCRRQAHCPRWHKGPWGLCSKSCGGLGISRRDVSCRVGRTVAGIGPHQQMVSDSECLALEPKPSETRSCGLAKCPTYHWRVGAWSKCVDPCKASTQRRRVFCMSDTGKRAAMRMCTENGTGQQPMEHRKCPTDKCPYHWVPGPWTTCSRSCGSGYKFRRIECKVRHQAIFWQRPNASNNNSTTNGNQNELLVADAEPAVLSRMCMSLEKPLVSAQCEMNPCSAEFYWNVGPWSQCSKNCGPGFRRRKVRCLDRNSQRAQKGKCNEQNRPKRREPCFIRNCLPNDCAELREQNANTAMMDGNYTVLVTGFRVTVYCRMMNESIPKTYLNVLSDTNFAEFYGKRLSNPYSCPFAGARNDSCACTNDGHVQAGLTRFSKVRVDLQNMKINPNDYTFAHTEHGNRIAFGTAGDCYSASNECPQGRFSIDLRGTGLRLVDDLQWTSKGHRTSIRIGRSENNAMVKGYCGGYCGECAPDRFKGIVVEVDQRQKPFVGLG